MSSNIYRNQLEQLQKEKAKLESDLAAERSRLARLQKEAAVIYETISTTKNDSTRRTKQREHSSKQEQIAKTQAKIADLEKRIAAKVGDINQKSKSLMNAEASENKKRRDTELRHLEDVNAEIEQRIALENTRQKTNLFAGRQGEPLKLSQEARDAARRLLEMFERKEIEKESRLLDMSSGGGTSIYLFRPNSEQRPEFSVPIADVKELAAYGVLDLVEIRRNGRQTGWNMLLLPERLKEVVADKTFPAVFRIFYSWQSWTPGKLNRYFIEEALEKATKEIRDNETIEVEPVIDRDTYGEAGSVDISATIFRKIRESHIFVCDATIITHQDAHHPSPNPNVMIELGYAAAILGWERIVCIMNTAYGNVEKMPFDLRSRRLLTYDLPDGADSKAEVKRKLTSAIREAISIIIERAFSEPREDRSNTNDI